MRPRADDPSLDRVRTGTPQSTAARSSWALVSESSVVAHLAQSLDQHLRACLLSLLIFWEVLGSDPSLDFGVGYVGWEVAGEPLANVGRGLEQVARLLPDGRGGKRSRRGAAVGGGGVGGVPPWVGGGSGGEGELSAVRAGRGRAGETSSGGVSGVVSRGRCRSPAWRPEKGMGLAVCDGKLLLELEDGGS